MSRQEQSMVMCCDPLLAGRVADTVDGAVDAILHGTYTADEDASTWSRSHGAGGTIHLNAVDGGLSIDLRRSDEADPVHDMMLSVPMPESARHDDRSSILSVLSDMRTMTRSILSPDHPAIVSRIRELTEMALDMSAVLRSAGVRHSGVRLRCGMQRPAAAFVASDRWPMIRFTAPCANWNTALEDSPHAFASIQAIGSVGGANLAAGGAVVDVDASATTAVDVLRRLPDVPVHLRKLL